MELLAGLLFILLVIACGAAYFFYTQNEFSWQHVHDVNELNIAMRKRLGDILRDHDTKIAHLRADCVGALAEKDQEIAFLKDALANKA